ncbi:GNAT family N-acetyltransferase [Vagococcus intermedius]|uniref:GNAT family N-acetyltransferase n=1 Tax=Vagococcus intermedius TaxID=2991418 RepID=A0AAF0CUL9_9ENTE|nr:GNAT family N-acetyltransferase [Vagococcus intermedius]WEG73293.1 GNAT family N-acetyltransferase [Vagococcus intermedius]WEG75374.1 GNAT family N-acetyltransferase [Vagococcus intermedius]
MTIRLVSVTENNWRAICALSVGPNQINTIETNQDSLLEAAYDQSHNWHPFGLYHKETLVGFTMIGAFDTDEQTIWLDRLMIDQNYQGKTYGHQAIKAIISYIHQHYVINAILLSVHAHNHQAITFYEKHMFSNTQKIDPENNELIFKRHYTD